MESWYENTPSWKDVVPAKKPEKNVKHKNEI